MDSDNTSRPDCWNCAHVRSVPGSAHKACGHPAIQGIPAIAAAATLRVSGAVQGIEGGWFRWPHNFDPVWLTACEGFSEADS